MYDLELHRFESVYRYAYPPNQAQPHSFEIVKNGLHKYLVVYIFNTGIHISTTITKTI